MDWDLWAANHQPLLLWSCYKHIFSRIWAISSNYLLLLWTCNIVISSLWADSSLMDKLLWRASRWFVFIWTIYRIVYLSSNSISICHILLSIIRIWIILDICPHCSLVDWLLRIINSATLQLFSINISIRISYWAISLRSLLHLQWRNWGVHFILANFSLMDWMVRITIYSALLLWTLNKVISISRNWMRIVSIC